MTLNERCQFCIEVWKRLNPDPKTELNYRSPFELLVAVILSAQCTDRRVNETTPRLFAQFPTAVELSKADKAELAQLIYGISFHVNKSGFLVEMSKILVEKHGGEVPQDWEVLRSLPGVGRKTANVVSAEVWGYPAIGVDTHVFRVSQRIGLVKPSKTPEEVETQLMKHVPKQYLGKIHHWILLHGRYICVARRPKCEVCPLTEACRWYVMNVSKVS